VIDVTFVGPGPSEVKDWTVLDDYSASDHRYVTFSIVDRRKKNEQPVDSVGWAFRKLDVVALARRLGKEAPDLATDNPTEEMAEKLSDYLMGLCDASMSRRGPGRSRRSPVPWRSQKIADLQATAIRTRRVCLRSVKRKGHEESLQEREAFRVTRKALRIGIRSYQERCWEELCRAVDDDLWGVLYRVVTKRLSKQTPGIAARGREHEISDALFPSWPVID